jgi:Flp pilus assembly protein TadB
VIANLPLVLAILGGGVAGYGAFLLIAQTLPAPPALGPALARLHPGIALGRARTPLDLVRDQIRVPHADLAILGRTKERYFVTLGLSVLFALFLPAFLTLVSLVTPLRISAFIPVGITLVAAAGFALLAHRDVVAKAAAARQEFTRAMCTYLDLAAHQVLGGHGPMESLERAATICHGWAFSHVRGALLRAQLQLTPPWDELKQISAELEVPELGDLADIMRSSSTEGAHVYQTLRARADSLRDQIRTQALELAEVRTNKLDVPAAALILVLLVLVGYPFMARLLSS